MANLLYIFLSSRHDLLPMVLLKEKKSLDKRFSTKVIIVILSAYLFEAMERNEIDTITPNDFVLEQF